MLWDDDPFDLDSPEELALVVAGGLLDDGEPACACSCGCERPVEWPDDVCPACQKGRHWNPANPDDLDRPR